MIGNLGFLGSFELEEISFGEKVAMTLRTCPNVDTLGNRIIVKKRETVLADRTARFCRRGNIWLLGSNGV